MLLEQLAHSAVGGFGASFGRDLYRSAKKNPLIFGLVGALLLAFGWRNLFLGRDRSFVYKLFITFIGSAIMIVAGTILLGLVGIYLAALLAGEGQQPNILIPAAIVGIVSVVGIMWGRRDARTRRRAAEIEAKNVAFLAAIGLEDSGFESDTLRDANGNTLKVREQNEDRIVFSVANRRGVRAAIGLQDGEMISYTGIIRV